MSVGYRARREVAVRIGPWLMFVAACGQTPERVPTEFAAATEYCELTAVAFCDYYLRCDRMAVQDADTCRDTFLEGCNARFEPTYAALDDEGLLALSVEGMGTCATHLRTVACDQQVFDLDGACGDMWQGQGAPGTPCGLGIESFVCDDTSTCVLGLDFCGTCESTVPLGANCQDARCEEGTSCVSNVCIADAQPGDACSDEEPCRNGTRCTDGTCVAPNIVGVGASCDFDNRCQYRAECIDGTCVQAGLLGDACADELPCASGWCSGGVCTPLLTSGETCTSSPSCGSGICADGTCAEVLSACITDPP